MNILMVTSETVPFSKSGGLADVVGALSSALAQLNNKVSILMPAYEFIDLKSFSKPIVTFEIKINNQLETVKIIEKDLGGVKYLALIHPVFSQRLGIYGDNSFTPYADNFSRYTLLAKAALPLCKALNFKVDIIHAHDWTVGFIPYLLKQSKEEFFKKTKSIFTIHNLAYQGTYSKFDALSANIPLDEKMFSGNTVEKQVNMLKTGIEFSDYVTTVSPTYAKEIQTKELGCNLEEVLKERKNDLFGIINGIDYDEWNPETDSNFLNHFNLKDFSGKVKLKAEIQKEFGLKVDPDIPLFSMISRLAEQKGFFELLFENEECALETILRNNKVQFIIIGTGDQRIVDKLKELDAKYNNLSINILFSNKAAHKVEGGSDFFLMPSRYEPCGLNQLYSLRYGTLPVARKTGGLADTILDINEHPEKGTGFLFSDMNSHAIIEIIEKAISLYYSDKVKIKKMKIQSMQTDFTWDKSAKQYIEIYHREI
ncbi:MAG: glycogen synthase [Spirochaetaceae bacterium]|nr:glycogen synthase [Spirochaetaceae bacterium]